MEPFLKTLAHHLFNKYGEDIQDIVLVFPNRRAGLFFRQYLSEAADRNIWSPRTLTINELMLELSDLQLADPVDIIFEIYNVYSQLKDNPESFDDFYPWGELMISDFDDIDKYMINAEDLFMNIIGLKEIDDLFNYITPEQKEIIRKFWGHFMDENPSIQKDSFLKLWKLLYPCYSQLKINLKKKSLAYEGMIYRDVAEKIAENKLTDQAWNKILFIGFNALNEAEKIIFRYLQNSKQGEFYWDYDRYYIDNPAIEAGRFLRKNIKEFPPSDFPEQFSNPASREICIYELPSDVTQAKFVYKLLEKRNSEELMQFHDTAIVLGNEDLLIPVLTSLPSQISDVNITMGYPINITPVYSFIDRLLSMQKKLTKQKGKKGDRFYYRDVLAIINHQYIRTFQNDKFSDLLTEINTKNRIYLDKSCFRDKGLLEKIFIKVDSIDQLIEYLVNILIEVESVVSTSQPTNEGKLEKEYIVYFLSILRKLRETFRKYKTELNLDTFSKLLTKIISTIKIPFEGEPLGGIQIMGILETRLLDFKNLIILSMNEGVFPRNQSVSSFIPNNLRYAFGMPTREDHDAIFAYYFFRSIQKSSNVSLLYNSRMEGVKSGEKSRYLYQLLYDKRFNVDFKSIGFNINERKPVSISIPKSPEVIKILEKYKVSGNSYLSPSALSTYLDCRLKFYFSRLAGLQEIEEVDEEIQAKDLGNLLHHAMYSLYKPWTGMKITPGDIEKLKHPDKIKSVVDESFRKEFYKTTDESFEVTPEGQNIIVYEVIKKYIEKILNIDKLVAPFDIVELEMKYESELVIKDFKIKLGGKIDRIDRKDNIIRIIDYKTGKAETNIKCISELFDREKSKRNKAVFQVMLYGLIFEKSIGSPVQISPGLYITKKIFTQDFDPLIKLQNENIDFLNVSDEFNLNLEELVAEIFDEKVGFTQTENEENCSYCPYAGICHRKGSKSF